MDNDQITGILSNWNRIESQIRVGLHEDFGKSKDIQDILDLIHDLQVKANTVTPIRDLLAEHMADLNNPHKVVIDLDELDLINTLYSLYTEQFGITMTVQEFAYAIINIKRFATRDDVDNNTNLDSIMNLDVVNYAITKHDTNPDAHANLLRWKLPGIPLTDLPSEVLEPSIHVPKEYNVDRPCGINYHDINGRVRVALPNTLASDYSYGRPATAIFGPYRNVLLNSKSLTDVNPYGGGRNITSNLMVITPIDDLVYLLFQEANEFGRHGFHDVITAEVPTGVNNYLIYAYPLDRSKLIFEAFDNTNALIFAASYDCVTLETKVSVNDYRLYASIERLPNGWHRCSITFDATGLNVRKFDVNVVDVFSPTDHFNAEYQGADCTAMAFWQHQLTKTSLPAPPVFTDNLPAAVFGTKLTRDFSQVWNPTHGSFVLRYISPMTERSGVENTVLRIGHNGIEPKSTVCVGSNPIDPKRNRVVSYDANSNILETIDSNPYDPDNPTLLKRVVFSYSPGYQGYGFTDQAPIILSTSYEEIVATMLNFFRDIYDGSLLTSEVDILQLPQDMIIPDDITDTQLPTTAFSNTKESRLNDGVNIIEIGYDSITDTYMEGYLMSFRYYSVFSSAMNIEFLLNQYIPKTT